MPDPPDAGAQPANATSLTLLQRLQAREPEAWQVMVRLYTPLVAHWCGRSGVAGADADDVLQDVFRVASSGMDHFRRDRPGDTFRGWLRGITRNLIREHLRRDGRQPRASGGTDAMLRLQAVSEPPEEDGEDESAQVGALYRRALELVRGEFEERSWQMFWRTFVEERRPADVAADMGVTPAAVRKAKSRVLHRLMLQVGDLVD